MRRKTGSCSTGLQKADTLAKLSSEVAGLFELLAQLVSDSRTATSVIEQKNPAKAVRFFKVASLN